jgi:predicted nuclease with TOPRIM domain
MNTIETPATPSAAQNVLASAVAHQIERMSKEELQALVAKAHLELQNENAALKQRVAQLEEEAGAKAKKIEKLEADKTKLHYKIARLEFDETEYDNFDPSEYTIPFEQTLAEANKLFDGYGGDAP